MGDHTFRLPDVGEGIAEAEIVTWLVAVGDEVAVDQPLVEVMTEKATIEITSPVAGTVSRLGGVVGASVAVGAELVHFGASDATDPSPPPPPVEPPSGPEPPISSTEPPPPPARAAAPSATPQASGPARPLAAPSVRRRAADAGIDLRRVPGTGAGGRVVHADLDRAVAEPATPLPSGSGRGPDLSITEVPMVGMRRKIAERMTLSKARIPHITYVEEVDVTALEQLRATLNEGRDREERLTILPFLVRALVRAVADHPTVNARFDDEAGVVHQVGGIHLGIATQTPRGLVVPVLRHAEAHDLWSSATEIRRLADAARDGSATREELSGSSLTVTSLGALGGVATTPVINHPEVAIVGVNKIAVRPVWDGTTFVPRQVMNLSSGFDHRIIDGWVAARFVQRLKTLLEQPAITFIEGA